MIKEKYRTNELCQYDYSEIWERSFNEETTDKPLRNDEIVDLLNEQDIEIQRLEVIVGALKHALKHIKQIEVEIDLNK